MDSSHINQFIIYRYKCPENFPLHGNTVHACVVFFGIEGLFCRRFRFPEYFLNGEHFTGYYGLEEIAAARVMSICSSTHQSCTLTKECNRLKFAWLFPEKANVYHSKINFSATRNKAENTITELLGIVRLLTIMEQETVQHLSQQSRPSHLMWTPTLINCSNLVRSRYIYSTH